MGDFLRYPRLCSQSIVRSVVLFDVLVCSGEQSGKISWLSCLRRWYLAALSWNIRCTKIRYFTEHDQSSSNFGGLVLYCVEAEFCNQILILQHLSRSTRFLYAFAPVQIIKLSRLFRHFSYNCSNFCNILNACQQVSSNFASIMMKIHRNFAEYSTSRKSWDSDLLKIQKLWRNVRKILIRRLRPQKSFFLEFWQNFNQIMICKIRKIRSRPNRISLPCCSFI